MTGELWTEQQVSDKTGIPVGTLRYWRTKKAVLPYRKLGALVRYDPAEVQAAIDAAKVGVTA
jgi:DNA-binding transcriptional MerR regulator